MNASVPHPESLEHRAGLPDDLKLLLARYPRETWKGHANLGDMAQFWLSRHAMFRELGTMLDQATGRYREGSVAPRAFASFFAPRLQFFLEQLHTHHHIEDHHYFPIFSAAEDKLARGFVLLEGDHEALARHIAGSIETANDFLRNLEADADTLKRAGEAYARSGSTLLRGLLRHLDDEEDLIVPLILDRGETALGVGH